MFSNAKQHIPELFRQKMEVDAEIEKFASRDVIPLSEHHILNDLKNRRLELRQACEVFCRLTAEPNRS